MRSVNFKKINAFASKNSSGNPAAMVYLNSLNDLSDDQMLQIAKELKGFVSEVGYVCPGTDTDFQLRYFSSEREVAFCGHATIGILNELIASDKNLLDKETLTISTNTEKLVVENQYKNEKCVYISAPLPKFYDREINRNNLTSALNCDSETIDTTKPVEIINAGLNTLIVPITGLDYILSINPDLDTLNKFCQDIGADIIILYTSETVFDECTYRTRVFAPTYGYLEDPATGSGNSALGCYLLKHNLWFGKPITIEQNSFRENPNFVRLYAKVTDDSISQVWFGGGAQLQIDGKYILP